MTPVKRQGKFLDTRQRSFHLTDDVYAIVQERAAAEGISNSGWISNLIRTGAAAPVAAKQEPPVWETPPTNKDGPATRKDAATAAPAKNKREIALPDERVSTFKVEGNRVRTKRLKSDDQLGGIEL